MFRIFTAVLFFMVGYLVGTGAISVNADIAGPAITNAADYVTTVGKDVYATFTESTPAS